MKAVLIYGPPGSGKTTHRKALAQHYGKKQIIEASDNDILPPYPADALVLSVDPLTTDAIHIRDACQAAGLPIHHRL